jgi:hypothetical protein
MSKIHTTFSDFINTYNTKRFNVGITKLYTILPHQPQKFSSLKRKYLARPPTYGNLGDRRTMTEV